MNLIERAARRVTRPVVKALYDLHPELENREPLLRMRSDEASRTGGGFHEGADFYEANVWVRRAVQKIAENIAWLPLQIQDRETGEVTYDHSLIDLLLYVNDSMDPIDLWTQWATDLLIGGESGFELVRDGAGNFREVWVRQPHHIIVRVAKGPARRYGGIQGYTIDDSWGDPYQIPPEDFVHFKFYNPANPWRGLSLVAAVRIGVLIDEFARAWSRMVFQNGARPDMAVVAPQGLTRTEKDEIERRFAAKYSGLGNAHGVVALEDGITDVKPINYTPRDTEWMEQRGMSRTEIAAIYGVPEEVMGFGRDTYENFDTAMWAFWTLTLVPLVRSRDARLTEFARRNDLLSNRERVTTDLSGVDVLREDEGQKIEQVGRLFEMGVPFNEAARYVGVDLEVDGGDVGYLPITLVRVGSNPRAIEPVTDEERAMSKGVPPFGSDAHRNAWAKKIERVEPFEERMMRMLGREFQRQQNEINRRLRNTEGHDLGRGLARGAIEGPDRIVKQNLLNLFDPYQEAERWRAEFGPLMAEALTNVGLEEIQDLGLDIDFDLNRPEVQAELGEILGKFARKVNETTYNDLRPIFSEAESEGASIPDIIEMLSGYWEGRKSIASRERIARTTMTSINNAGDEAVWGQTEHVKGSEWLAALDERTRPAHREAHGQKRRQGQMFNVGGENLAYPGDPGGSPANIINCRCTRVAVLIDEEI
jgi:HK97 family phage portal protein